MKLHNGTHIVKVSQWIWHFPIFYSNRRGPCRKIDYIMNNKIDMSCPKSESLTSKPKTIIFSLPFVTAPLARDMGVWIEHVVWNPYFSKKRKKKPSCRSIGGRTVLKKLVLLFRSMEPTMVRGCIEMVCCGLRLSIR